MRRALLVGLLAALACAPPAAAVSIKGVEAGDHPYVTVTVVTPRPSADPPVLAENGKRIRTVEARTLADGKSVVLAIDRSRSMAGGALDDAIAAVRSFVRSKPASDRLAVVAFGSKAVELTRFSSATIDADIALRTISTDAVQGTALYDAVVLGSRRLADEEAASRVLVVLTDGADVSSSATLGRAVAAARRARVAVYAVAIESAQFSPAPLRSLAARTGGRYFGTASAASLVGVYRALADELSRTWRLTYLTAAAPGERATLRVADGGSSARTSVVVPGSEGARSGSGLLPAFMYESAFGTLLVAVVVGVPTLVALLFLTAAKRSTWLRNRLQPHVVSRAGREDDPQTARERLALASELFQATERSLAHLRPWRALERLVERADFRLRTVQVVWASGGVAFAVGLLAALFGLPTFLILGLMALGALAPIGLVVRKARKRTKAFDEQLPDILLTIAASLKAGHSFKQGIGTIVEDSVPPASAEFQRVLSEMQLGRPMDEALGAMATRVGSANFEFVMTAVTIQRQVGGSLAGLFDTVAQTVRDRQQFARKIRGLTAMGRGSAYLLVALPFVLAGILTLLNGEYMIPLFTTSAGHMMIGVGLASMTVGALILKKIVAFKG